MTQKGLEKEEREKEITFPQKVFLSRIISTVYKYCSLLGIAFCTTV